MDNTNIAPVTPTSDPGDIFNPPAPTDYGSIFHSQVGLGTGSDSGNKFASSLIAMTAARNTQGNMNDLAKLMDNYHKSITDMPQSQIQDYLGGIAASNMVTGLNKYVDDMGNMYARNQSPDIQDAAKQTVKDTQDVAQQGTLGDALVQGTYLAMKNEKNPVQRYTIRTLGMTQMFSEFMDNHFTDVFSAKAFDFAGLFLPGRATVGNLFHGVTPERLHQLAVDFHNEMPEQQVQDFPKVLEYAYHASGNNRYVFEQNVEPFFNHDDVNAAYKWLALDAIDVAATIPAVLKLAKLAKISTTPIRIARDLGDKEMAGKMAGEAAMDSSGKSAAIFGTNQHDAAAMAMPFGGEAVIKEITNGVNVEAQAKIEEMLGPLHKVLNRIVSGANEEYIIRGALTAPEEAAYQKKIMNTYAGTAKVVDSTEHGFTVRVSLEQAGHTPENMSEAAATLGSEKESLAGLKVQRSELKVSLGDGFSKDKDFQDLTTKIVASNKKILDLETMVEQAGNAGNEALHTPIEFKDLRYTRNAVGSWDVIEYSLANKYTSAADTIVHQIANGEVFKASLIEYTQKQIRDLYNIGAQELFKGNPLRNIFGKGLSKKEVFQLNTLLDHGYNVGKETRFTTAQLLTGIQTKQGVIRITSAEQLARYHGVRDILDSVYMLNNSRVRKQLLFEGFDKSIKVRNFRGEMLNFMRSERGLATLPENIQEIYDTTVGRVIKVGSKDIIDGRIARGEVGLYEMKLPVEYERGKKVTYVLADKSAIRELPDKVLNYKAHYRPQIYKNIFHVAVEHTEDFINGNKVSARKILRGFDSETHAQRFVDLPENTGRTIEIRAGNEFRDPNLTDKALREEYETKIFGGLFTGEADPIPLRFGLENTSADTVSALEAMESAVNNVATQVPMNEWRMGIIQRFLNSAKNPASGESYLSDATNWRSVIKPNSPNGVEYMQKWMGHVFNVQTSEERSFNKAMFQIGSWMDNETMIGFKPANYIRKWAMNLSSTDVYGRIRTLAFHALLGWLNPRQLYVQAAGAMAAVSINPEKALYLVPRYMALRAVMYADNTAVHSIVREAMAKAGKGFMDEAQFIDMAKGFRKAGVQDSIRTTADYDAAVRGFGMSRTMIRKAADRGLYFLRESELFNRSYNWLWAYDKFMGGKTAAYRLTTADVDKITSESLRVGMNLMRANAAGFQKGILSIPLQFQQISTKFIGNMLYGMKSGRGNWTAFEKAKIGLGQVLMFGAAGVPFGTWATKEVINWAKDKGDYGLGLEDPDAIAAVSGGMTDYALGKWFGASEDVASSMSYGGNLTQFLEQFTNSDTSFAQIAQGAFGEVPRRAIKALGNIAPIIVGDIQAGDVSSGDMQIAIAELGTIVSSWRNVHKANMWSQSGILTNSKGEEYRYIDPEQDAGMLLAQRLGMSPKELNDISAHKKFQKAEEKDLAEAADAWHQLVLMHLNSGDYNTDSGRERAKFQVAWILKGLTFEEREKVTKMFAAKLQGNSQTIKNLLLKDIEVRNLREGDAAPLELTTTEIPKQ